MLGGGGLSFETYLIGQYSAFDAQTKSMSTSEIAVYFCENYFDYPCIMRNLAGLYDVPLNC